MFLCNCIGLNHSDWQHVSLFKLYVCTDCHIKLFLYNVTPKGLRRKHLGARNVSSVLTQRLFCICFHISEQHQPSTPDQGPLPHWLHLLVSELLQAGGGVGHLGRGSGGLPGRGREPGQHRHELRPGLRGRGRPAGPSRRLDRTQAQGADREETHHVVA